MTCCWHALLAADSLRAACLNYYRDTYIVFLMFIIDTSESLPIHVYAYMNTCICVLVCGHIYSSFLRGHVLHLYKQKKGHVAYIGAYIFIYENVCNTYIYNICMCIWVCIFFFSFCDSFPPPQTPYICNMHENARMLMLHICVEMMRIHKQTKYSGATRFLLLQGGA